MTHVTPSERAFFADLTRLFLSMQHSPQGEVEACIEERFRAFVRSNPALDIGALQITLTWQLPEGVDEYALYTTEYQTLPTAKPIRQRAAAGGPAEIVDFPVPRPGRQLIRGGASAEVIAFPRS